MKKLLLILLCLPMIGFGQDDKVGEMLRKKLQPVIEEYYIEKALNEGYKLTVENNKFICECTYNHDGDWIDSITNDYCSHNLARTYLYFPENRKIQIRDLNKDGLDDYIINYTIEGFGGGNTYVNYNATILGGKKMNFIKTE